MNKDKKTLCAAFIAFTCATLLACLVSDATANNILYACLCAAFAVIICIRVKKRSIHDIEKGQVAWVMAALAVIFLTIYYAAGVKFGYLRQSLPSSFIWRYIIPYAIIIVASEIIRFVLLAQKSRAIELLSYFTFVILDVAALYDGGAPTSFSRLADFLLLAVFPALAANILYHYTSKKYGMLPNIAYRIIITLIPYFISVKPNIPDAMYSIAKILVPVAICGMIYGMYLKRRAIISRRAVVVRSTVSVLLTAVAIGIVMLVSCQFRYGLLVIGSGSMSGEIEVGDAVIYERYDGGVIENGQVIVFKKNNSTVVHRVVDVKQINGVVRYYTKGDANDSMDAGYITADDMIGVVNLKIKYFGQPTLFVRRLFK